jgi:CII-binding regulator of phage lambda lysogenization HflD
MPYTHLTETDKDIIRLERTIEYLEDQLDKDNTILDNIEKKLNNIEIQINKNTKFIENLEIKFKDLLK